MQTEAYILGLLSKRRFFLNKQLIDYLRQVYGVGFVRASKMCNYCGVNKNYNLKVKEVSPVFFYRFQRFVFKKKYLLGRILKRRRSTLIRFLQQHKLYRGIRFYYSLPVRGQRTHTNRSTMRRWKKKKVVVQKKTLLRRAKVVKVQKKIKKKGKK
jgi:ribosomal protein S13